MSLAIASGVCPKADCVKQKSAHAIAVHRAIVFRIVGLSFTLRTNFDIGWNEVNMIRIKTLLENARKLRLHLRIFGPQRQRLHLGEVDFRDQHPLIETT